MKINEVKTSLPVEMLDYIEKFINGNEVYHILSAPKYLYEGFCMAATIIMLNLEPADFQICNNVPQDPARDADIRRNLAPLKKYKSKTSVQLSEKIAENNLEDIRNCFAHGNFEIDEIDGEKYFLLLSTKPKNITQIPLKIDFETIYSCIGKKIIAVNQERNSQFTEEEKETLRLALSILDLAMFFKDPQLGLQLKSRLDYIQENFVLIAHQLLLIYNTVFMQNNIQPMLNGRPDLTKLLCLYRNSTAHSSTIFSGHSLTFVDPGAKTPTQSTKTLTQHLEDLQELLMTPFFEEVKKLVAFLESSKSQFPEDIDKFDKTIATLQNYLDQYYETLDDDETENFN